MNRKQQKQCIDNKLQLSMLNFVNGLPYIVRKFFWRQALDYYCKGRDDVLTDYLYLQKEWTRLGINKK